MSGQVYVVAGPTASGKTALAVELAQRLGGEVISADSMQIYKEMDIGTAKPTVEERRGIAHHMLDIIAPDEAYSAAQYQKQARTCMGEIQGRGAVPIVAGGTGLYVNALTHALDFSAPKGDTQLREELNALDAAVLYTMLQETDAAAAERIHPNNKKRVVRAIEIARLRKETGSYDFEKVDTSQSFHIVGIAPQREALYQNINRRVNAMLAKGLMQEVEWLYKKYGKAHTSMQAIGYKEPIAYLEGKYGLEQAIELIKRNTRRLAKRQFTWFKRDARLKWYNPAEYDGMGELAKKILQDK